MGKSTIAESNGGEVDLSKIRRHVKTLVRKEAALKIVCTRQGVSASSLFDPNLPLANSMYVTRHSSRAEKTMTADKEVKLSEMEYPLCRIPIIQFPKGSVRLYI
jgi:hypothetical protein